MASPYTERDKTWETPQEPELDPIAAIEVFSEGDMFAGYPQDDTYAEFDIHKGDKLVLYRTNLPDPDHLALVKTSNRVVIQRNATKDILATIVDIIHPQSDNQQAS